MADVVVEVLSIGFTEFTFVSLLVQPVELLMVVVDDVEVLRVFAVGGLEMYLKAGLSGASFRKNKSMSSGTGLFPSCLFFSTCFCNKCQLRKINTKNTQKNVELIPAND